ncbi:MAG TPA: DEAD/DEAH box helicase [Thermoanaerobaculaceae bacterium]|nr:DEAD/DEAH box helicase [Thermoanaerobaculaceae bacterium]HRS14726.1 DEAD/DEAH box helicase [Thermoanaerobaculaceae bacterium]
MDTPSTLFSQRTFDELDLPEPVRAGLRDAGFARCTLVQADVLPLALAGRDVAAQAQTGTGKTAAYLITIFTRLLAGPRPDPPQPRALVVAPTRELVVQVAADAERLGAHVGLHIEAVFGGMDYRAQREELRAGVDLLVGTPGRLIDYLEQGITSLRHVQVFVVDEADRMFDMGFVDDLRRITRRLPPPGRRQTLFFTATLSNRVLSLGYSEMRNPAEVVVNPEEITPDRLEQRLYHVGSREKFSLLLGLLATEGCSRTMLFVNTREEARRLVERLERHGYVARGLTGSVIQRSRLRVLQDFKEGKLPLLVATDVASRGLHIEGVTHVINYDLPFDPEDYVHRVGRTARVGREGKAISLACDNFVYSLPAIEKLLGFQIPVAHPDDSLFLPVKSRPRPDELRRGRRRERRAAEETAGPTEAAPAPAEPAPPAAAAPAPGAAGSEAAPSRKRRRRRRRHRSSEQAGTPPAPAEPAPPGA